MMIYENNYLIKEYKSTIIDISVYTHKKERVT